MHVHASKSANREAVAHFCSHTCVTLLSSSFMTVLFLIMQNLKHLISLFKQQKNILKKFNKSVFGLKNNKSDLWRGPLS